MDGFKPNFWSFLAIFGYFDPEEVTIRHFTPWFEGSHKWQKNGLDIVFMHFWMVKNLVFGVFWLFLAILTPKGHNSPFHPEV